MHIKCWLAQAFLHRQQRCAGVLSFFLAMSNKPKDPLAPLLKLTTD